MGKQKLTRKISVAKRIIGAKDPRIKKNQDAQKNSVAEENEKKTNAVNQVNQVPTSMFFQYNDQLGPPYHVLVDTNFINFSIKNKLEIYKSMMDCLLAKCIPCITDCVMAELEKLGSKYKLALKLAKDPRFHRVKCTHKGTYADDCLLQRCQQHRCYIIATCDKDLRKRIRKVPGVPIMYINSRKYSIERMPEAFGAPKQ
jgi:U3 small nucleolar RNA-associated protein 24